LTSFNTEPDVYPAVMAEHDERAGDAIRTTRAQAVFSRSTPNIGFAWSRTSM